MKILLKPCCFLQFFIQHSRKVPALFLIPFPTFFQLPCVCLVGNVTWFPDEFLATNMPATSKVIENKMQDQALTYRSAWLSTKMQSISRYVHLHLSIERKMSSGTRIYFGMLQKKKNNACGMFFTIYNQCYVVACSLTLNAQSVDTCSLL